MVHRKRSTSPNFNKKLLLETILGLIVLIRCFTEKDDVRLHVSIQLGDGFLMAPFSALVALCTLTPLLVSIPLGELLFFHMLLIRKGITTYEYVIAMRARYDPQKTVEMGRQGISSQKGGSSSRGFGSVPNLLHHGAWCTPRMVKQQGEVSSRLDDRKLPCTIDADSTTVVERKAYKSSRHAIKISALKLALLNSKEAAQAAMKARECSSVLRPVGFHSVNTAETDCGSSCDVSTTSSSNLVYGLTRKESGNSAVAASPRHEEHKEERDMESLGDRSSNPGSAPLSPLPAERRLGNPNTPRTSVNQINGLGNARQGLQVCSTTILPRSSTDHPSWIRTTPINDGYDTSRGNQTSELGRSHIVSVNVCAKGENLGDSRMTVYWDRAAGRFRLLPRTKTVSNLLPKPTAVETRGGPHSILSPGRHLVNAANPARALGPSSLSAPRNCGKENSLKWPGGNCQPALTRNHIVLPIQSCKGPATPPCKFSACACRSMPKR